MLLSALNWPKRLRKTSVWKILRTMLSSWARHVLGGPDEPSSSNAEASEAPKLPFASRALRIEGAEESDKASDASDLSPLRGAETPGSRRHGTECNPCAWYWKPQGCQRGSECGYCHLCPEGEVKLRKKAKLAAMRGAASPSSTTSGLSPTLGHKEDADADVEVPDRQLSMSVGAQLHGTGECKPCAWFWKPKGCQNGEECRHCHLCLRGEIRQRKKAKDKHATPQNASSHDLDPATPMEPLKVEIGGEAQKSTTPLKVNVDMPGVVQKFESLSIGNLEEPQKVAPSPTSALPDSPIIAPPPGLAANVGVPSVGSASHGTGLCRPCAWLWKPGGCQNGSDCLHCHLCPEGELKARKKVKADLARQESFEQEILSSPLALSLAQMLDEDDANQQAGLGAFMMGTEGADGAAHVFPSEGSKLHGSGYCRPCAWFWKPKGCENGSECRHCHLCPQEEIKNRRKAKQMMQSDQGSPMMWPGNTWTPLSAVDSMVTQTPASMFPGREFSDPTVLTPLELGSSPMQSSAWDSQWDAFGAASPTSPESPKLAIELANCLPVPSAGSTLHGTGKCKPCAWFHKPTGCSNGDSCAHCHLCPEDEIRNRKKAKEAALRAGALEPKRDADGRNPRTVRIAPLLGSE